MSGIRNRGSGTGTYLILGAIWRAEWQPTTAKSANDRQDRQRPPRPPRPPTSNGSREPEPLAVLAVQQRKGLFVNDLRELLVRQPLGGLGGPRFVSKRGCVV